MIINPIIPIWLMAIICVVCLIFKRKGTFNYIRQILIVILLFVVNLRIMLEGNDATNMTCDVDVLFVIDNTISMLAEDYNGDGRRIDAVKEDCAYIMEKFSGASFSVVTFGNSVERMMPYTVDSTMVLHAIDVLNGQTVYYANGTSLNDVMSQLGDIMENDRETYKLIFFISDGEIVNSEELKSYSDLKNYVDAGAVLGYGTKDGGAMKVLKYAGDEEAPEYLYYYDEDYNRIKAISKIDEANLKKIASDLGSTYIHMTKQSDMDDVLDALYEAALEQATYSENSGNRGYTETYYFFAIPLLLLLIFDFVYYKRKM